MDRLSGQWRGLTGSQRVAIGLGVIMVLGSLVWLAQWAATPEFTPLLPQDLGSEDLARVTSGLDALGETYTVDGARVMVRASANRQGLLAQLQSSDKLPSDTSVGFAALVRESNPWISQEENNKRWTVALQNELQQVLSSLAGVHDARVFLNLNSSRLAMGREAQSSASVTLFMRGGAPVTRALALSAARLVSGSVRGLPLRSVQVVDASGGDALDWDAETPGSGSALNRQRRDEEARFKRMIEEQVAFDPQVRVSVRVELDPTAREAVSETPIEGVEKSTTSRTREEIQTARAAQPGVQPNVGNAVGAGAADTRKTESETKSELQTGRDQKTERTPAGEIKEIFAAINVSHSALAAIHNRANPGADPPTREQIDAIFQIERAKIVNQVRKLVKPQEEDQVAVDWYYDEASPATVAEAEASLPMMLLEKHGVTSALLLLAVAAMGFTLRLARRSDTAAAATLASPAEALSEARNAAETREPPKPPKRDGAAAVISDPSAIAADQVVIEATELDPEAMNVKAMVDQIGTAADTDADDVASLLEKWISQTK